MALTVEDIQAIVAAVRIELAPELAKINSLPNDPADNSEILAAISGIAIAGTSYLYAPTTATRVIGDNEGGDVTSLAAHDGTYMRTGEVTGTGLEVTVTCAASNIAEIPSVVRVSGSYRGGASHVVYISAWDFTLSAWVQKATMADRADDFDYVFSVGSVNQDPATGEMRLQFKHNVISYTTSHALYLDSVTFEKVATTDQLGSDVAQILANQQDQMQMETITHGVAQGPGANNNQIQLSTEASPVDGAYDPSIISIHSGAGAGQCRIILQYDGATRTATVNRDWKTPVDSTSNYHLHEYADLQSVNEGLIRAATTSTVQLNASASSVTGAYVGQLIFLVSGMGQDQTAVITAYDGATKTATVETGYNANGWTSLPDTTTGYVIMPSSPVLVSAITQSKITALPTAVQIRAELAPELAKMDVAVSTRLSASSYIIPSNASIAAILEDTDALRTAVALIETKAEADLRQQTIVSNQAAILTEAEIGRKLLSNRDKIDTTTKTWTIYEDDKTTPLAVYDLKGQDGQPNALDPFEKVPR